MKIKLNNRDKILPDNLSITELVKILGYTDSSGIAIAMGTTVIPKTDWDNKRLSEGDSVTIIQATCGG
ncbi:MAG: thiamine biosynthesis protein ThiS [Bacteroidetes bacterium]|nr:thiamine biosynthesis protein ThiS [Bacteroidota bacterium]